MKDVHGPVPYLSKWMKTSDTCEDSQRYSLKGCDMWCLEIRSLGFEIQNRLSIIVQDVDYYKRPHEERLNTSPAFETFVFFITEKWSNSPGRLVHMEH